MSYTPVDDFSAIDMTRHAFIEASAGTGKTYTLENMVVRLLKERGDIAIENILMVTFTEKATSELKIRIQEKLVAEIHGAADRPEDQGRVQKIQDTLDAFDTAAIYTIHGFCHSVLKDFAFENQSLFQNEVVDDAPLFDTLIKEQMRKVWPVVYGRHLLEMLDVAGFGARKDRFLTQVAHIAGHVYRPGVGDDLQPVARGRNMAQIRGDILHRVMALKHLIGPPPDFSDGFARLNINGRSKQSLLDKMVVPLERYFSHIDESRFYLPDLLDLMDQIRSVTSADRQGIPCLVPQKWLKAGNNIAACPQLEAIAARLTDLVEVLRPLRYYMVIEAVKQLQTDVVRFKRQNGRISYEDMLSLVATALDGDQGAELRRTLRAKYKVAFVDEFQDTDPVQWRIFKRLFLDAPSQAVSPSTANQLFLIGDPKQAIYSFRGADVFAYLEARNEMERLAASGRAGLYSLAINWRSKPDLVTAFNELFGRDPWFPAQDQAGAFQIGYQGAESPDESDLPLTLVADDSKRPVLNVVDLSDASATRPAKTILARFIAREVRHLMERGGLVLRDKNGNTRSLDYGDICILIRGKSDALLVESQLAALGIPYSFYKKPGLFLSAEALYLSLVCHAIQDPDNLQAVKKALLTPFFDCRPNDLPAYEATVAAHPLKQLFFHWHDLALGRQWGELFQSLLEDSGLLFRQAPSREWDRTHTNYRQILEHLEVVAYRDNMDFRGLSALLDNYRKQTLGARDDADIHQIETEAQKVQIMTMHVSKGLQFPVVFIAGGLTQPFRDDYHIYHDFDPDHPEAGIRKVIDLSKTFGREQHRQETYDEDKRLYYVALTRAQFKLYLPYFPAKNKSAWLGPVRRFVSPALGAAFPRNADHRAVHWLMPDALPKPGSDPNRMLQPGAEIKPDMDKVRPLLPDSVDYRSRRIMLESFSSLHARYDHGIGPQGRTIRFEVASQKDKADDEGQRAFAADTLVSGGAEDELPGGVNIGSMFHDILEQIDYEAVTRHPDGLLDIKETRDIIIRIMAAYRVEERWQPQVCRIVAGTLTTPIGTPEAPLVLGRLKSEDRMHEVEFFYPYAWSSGEGKRIPDCDTVVGSPCFIRGFVDLIFRYDGRFYIADWKSNRLDDGYDRPALDACMEAAGYHLQYNLYTVAVLRWLKQVLGEQFDAGSQFGGVYYFFLRGMAGGNGKGVYFVGPEEMGTPEDLDTTIVARLAGVV